MTARTRDDRGVTLVELLVAMVLLGVVGLIASSAVMWFQRTTTAQTRTAALWAHMQDASSQLLRDINDGQRILVAEPNALTIEVVRDSKCQIREWNADTATKRLSVSTTFYEQGQCVGTPSGTRTDRIIGDNAVGTNTSGTHPTQYTAATTFAYFEALSTTPLTAPIETDRVTRIEWDLRAQADDGYRPMPLKSGAAFTPRGAQRAAGGDQSDPKAPLLCNALRLIASGTPVCDTTPVVAAANGATEGKDAPYLQWVDKSAPGVTTGWTILRVANPEGMADADDARTGWQYLTSLPAATTSFKDTTLPDGYTAQYLVVSNVATGLGPNSNKIVSGLRPAPPTNVTATGAPTSITLTWTKSIGATGYDVYRDGKLAAVLGDTATWTDHPGPDTTTEDLWPAGTSGADSGYGHAHQYAVVAVNRWENRLTGASDTARLTPGPGLATAYAGGPRLHSADTPAAQAFTAPAAPTITATPTTTWGDTIAWAPAAWAGTGPSSKAGTARDRGWETQSAPLGGTFTDLWAGTGEIPGTTASKVNGSRAPGSTTQYQARTCNDVGCSPYSAATSSLQRPPAPGACTVDAVTTRSATVVVQVPAIESGYDRYALAGANADASGMGESTSPAFGLDRLTHGTTHSITVASHNGSPANGGWSDSTACPVTTVALIKPTVSVASITTRGAIATPSCANGTICSASIDGGAASRNDLPDGTWHSAQATNSDGYNQVPSDPVGFTTTLLTSPSCSVSGGGTAPGTVTVSASGSNGSEQVRLDSGSWYTTGSRGFGGLEPGSYTGYARATDGLNYTSTRSCGTATVAVPAPATPSPSGISYSNVNSCITVGSEGGKALFSFASVDYATNYEVQWQYERRDKLGTWSTTQTASYRSSPMGSPDSAGSSRSVTVDFTPTVVNRVRFKVAATNGAGSSAWSGILTGASIPSPVCD